MLICMSPTIDEYVQQITELGLLTADQMAKFRKGLPSDKPPRSAKEYARELIRQNLLTEFQAKSIYRGSSKNLVFGDYLILEKIGEGGMGQVYKSRDRRNDRLVAFKVLSTSAVKSSKLVKRFQQEIDVASRLDHSNIVKMYEGGKLNKVRFMAMEYVKGIDLLSFIKDRNRRLDVGKAVDYVLQAARGLEYAHRQGIIHRDIKPSNLLLDENRTIKILDMGLARVVSDDEDDDEDNRLTVAGQMLGTARFMSPEQIEDSRTADLRSDIYSLGCTLYFLLRRKAPYRGDTMAHIMIAHMTEPIPSICKKREDVPEVIERIFERMVAKQPDDRYQSMPELIADLEKSMGLRPADASDDAETPAAVTEPSVRPPDESDQSTDGDVSFTEVSFDEQSRYNANEQLEESKIEDVSEFGDSFGESTDAPAPDMDAVTEPSAVQPAIDEEQNIAASQPPDHRKMKRIAVIAAASVTGVAILSVVAYYLFF